MPQACGHIEMIEPVMPQSSGCEDCLASGRRDWVHLRFCLSCGHVGCCDSSPGRHATGHYHASDHPVMGSYEPGENWYWCYPEELAFEIEGAPAAPSHP
ncbi:MAG: UBP-type zinc finger domain-containing protein [Acidimicrobiales bacterium]